jgi:hypothetical protein
VDIPSHTIAILIAAVIGIFAPSTLIIEWDTAGGRRVLYAAIDMA